MREEVCCTCATLLSSISPRYDEKSEKPIYLKKRLLECCGRVICGECIEENPRFATYCPFCQVSSIPSRLPQGLRDPPAYSPASGTEAADPDGNPPAYIPRARSSPPPEKPSSSSAAVDVLHFLDPEHDTLASLSLRYGVPIHALRRSNGLFADHLLAARRTLVIPGEFYKGGESLSPRPIEGEEEEKRKAKIRRWMVACKIAEYDVALIYLKQSDYDLEEAIAAFKADERWEKEHPQETAGKGKGKQSVQRRKFGIGQLS